VPCFARHPICEHRKLKSKQCVSEN